MLLRSGTVRLVTEARKARLNAKHGFEMPACPRRLSADAVSVFDNVSSLMPLSALLACMTDKPAVFLFFMFLLA